jgi:hypothetical protein
MSSDRVIIQALEHIENGDRQQLFTETDAAG